jgi:hypothetical protein
MALQFKNLKSPLLDFHDKITVGKLTGCRVCDCIPDHYEYLIWANKSGMLHFTKAVTESIQEHSGFKNQQIHYEQEIEPWLAENSSDSIVDLNDVPF